MRESTASTTSTGETFFRAMAAARSAADIQQRSLLFMVAAIVCCQAMAAVAFGMFDHVDRSDEPVGVLYEQRLKLVEAAEAAGFRTYHVAEHHATRLGMAPSPGIFLAAVAQRTRRIRFGPLVYLLPLYTPLRLVEEIAMLDQMSGGRFELGVGRGISPYELAYCGVDFLEAPAMYAEALEVILAGLRGGRLTHRGRYYRYLDVPIELTPVQRPHPPLWQGVTSPEGAATAAGRGVNIVGTAPNARMKEVVDRYFETLAIQPGGSMPMVGLQRHVFVAETDAEAMAIARGPYKAWYDSLVSLWRQFNTLPFRFAESLARALAVDSAIVGSPATVRAEVERHLAATGANYFVGRFIFGNLGFEPAVRSLELFSTEVMPRFRDAEAALRHPVASRS
jgi:alkanesulfonate monooxygenase SsuD/methylene tetrahydromethanopterin reductase-like flavin-dependent oxidoreductase (luciferase family)